MYAAAGGASLASRQARRKQKQHHTTESMHLQFHKRFQQLQHQHAPACAEGYHYMRSSSSGLLTPSHLPSCTDLHDRGTAIDFSLQEHLLEVSKASLLTAKHPRGKFRRNVPTRTPFAVSRVMREQSVQSRVRFIMTDSSIDDDKMKTMDRIETESERERE